LSPATATRRKQHTLEQIPTQAPPRKAEVEEYQKNFEREKIKEKLIKTAKKKNYFKNVLQKRTP
jgi:hypothetical protein